MPTVDRCPSDPLKSHSAPTVTFGYLIAAAIAVALWFGIGVILLPVMLVMAVLHILAGPVCNRLAAGHHRWLAAHYLWSLVALLAVLVLPFIAIPALLADTATVFNTLVQAPHPLRTLAAAWPSFGHLPTLVGSGLILVFGWYVVTFWISFRLLRRGLRWAEGAPVR